MALWFTSDEHYDHRNVIKYCARPFTDVDAMREEMIRRHNARVAHEDDVWHLGDFSLSESTVPLVLPRLNGRHHLVTGNHDGVHPMRSKALKYLDLYKQAGFVTIIEKMKIELPGVGEVLLCHMPYTGDSGVVDRYEKWRPRRGVEAVLLHGHVHEKWRVREGMVNVGVDVWDFSPVSVEQIVKAINEHSQERQYDEAHV